MVKAILLGEVNFKSKTKAGSSDIKPLLDQENLREEYYKILFVYAN